MKYLKTYNENTMEFNFEMIPQLKNKLMEQCLKLKKYKDKTKTTGVLHTIVPFDSNLIKQKTKIVTISNTRNEDFIISPENEYQLEIYYSGNYVSIYLVNKEYPDPVSGLYCQIRELNKTFQNIIYEYIIDEDNYIDQIEATKLGLL